MEKKLSSIPSPGLKLYFIALFLFTGATFALRQWIAGAAELAVCLALLLFYLRSAARRKRAMLRYVEALTLNTDLVSNDSLANMPMPMVLLRVSNGGIIWCNDSFKKLTGCPEHYLNSLISELITGFDLHWILDGKTQHPELVLIGERFFDIRSSFIRPSGGEMNTLYAALYWIECTEEIRLRTIIDESRPVVTELLCDNYDELGKGGEAARASMMGALDVKLSEWFNQPGVMIRKTDRDRYLVMTDEKNFRVFLQRKFDILEKVRQITSPGGMPLTLSLGVGREGETLSELSRYARLALDMALSRGGDQTVVRSKTSFEFFGGMTREVEKRTKIKTRLMANVLSGLISESSTVYVMGHRIADIDSLGGAAGIVCAARKLGKKAFIVIDRNYNNTEMLIDHLESNPAYAGVLIDGKQAILETDPKSLLVVVDTNRSSYVEDRSLLESFNRIAVVDHHRRVSDYIDNAVLNVHEPAASSVCELIAELLQYIIEQGDMLRVEATAMLAGIVLDTKSFSLKTGSRTFEAAAYLRRNGADSVEIKRLFQSDIENYIKRAELVKSAKFIDSTYALTKSDKPVDRAVAAQAADDLMNITDVAGSFVLFPFENTISISARSLGRINMQLIMEKLGGGGHYTTAGAQLKGKTMDEAESMLMDAITLYNYENNTENAQ